MADLCGTTIKWLLIALSVSPMVIGIGWAMVEGVILPRLMLQNEIEGLADDLMRRFPSHPDEIAFVEEYAAWRQSNSFEQGKWRCVRTLIRQRLGASLRT